MAHLIILIPPSPPALQSALQRTLFPVGHLLKQQVKEVAREAGFGHVAGQKEVRRERPLSRCLSCAMPDSVQRAREVDPLTEPSWMGLYKVHQNIKELLINLFVVCLFVCYSEYGYVLHWKKGFPPVPQ